MANCPGCNSHIKIYQMSPYCKNCGIHLMFASYENQFEKDRRIAEMSMANFRYNTAKIKSAYISGKAQKFKIFASLFPLIALFLPLGNLSVDIPFYSSSLSFNVIDLFIGPFFTNGLFEKLSLFADGPVFGEISELLKTLMLIYAVMAVSAVFILLLELFSFIGNKAVCIMTMLFSITGIVSAIAFKIVSASFSNIGDTYGDFININSGMLFIAALILFAVPVASAFYSLKNPPVYTFREGDELRVEYRRKYKKGLIEFKDIPAPIYESEEDKAERQKLINQAYNISDEEVTVDV